MFSEKGKPGRKRWCEGTHDSRLDDTLFAESPPVPFVVVASCSSPLPPNEPLFVIPPSARSACVRRRSPSSPPLALVDPSSRDRSANWPAKSLAVLVDCGRAVETVGVWGAREGFEAEENVYGEVEGAWWVFVESARLLRGILSVSVSVGECAGGKLGDRKEETAPRE